MTIHQHPQERLRTRAAPLDMTSDQFRSLGHDLVDRIAELLASMRMHPVTLAESPEEVRAAISAKRIDEKGALEQSFPSISIRPLGESDLPEAGAILRRSFAAQFEMPPDSFGRIGTSLPDVG